MYSSVMNIQNPPKWASTHLTNLLSQSAHVTEDTAKINKCQQQMVSPPNQTTDDHYSRHLETVNNEKDEDEDCQGKSGDEKNQADELTKNEIDEDEDEPKDEEPKVFQVEDVDLPSLVTKPNSKPTSPLLKILKPSENFAFGKATGGTKPNFIVKLQNPSNGSGSLDLNKSPIVVAHGAGKVQEQVGLNTEINLTSTMATPMHYFSRSSSMTSLNSFDIKSIHSEIASEYSQFTSRVTSPSSRLKKDDFNHSDLLDDLENLNMPESPSALENSFLMNQRYIHKQQQAIYRQNAAVAMGTVNHQPFTITNMQQINKITCTQSSNQFRILKTNNDQNTFANYNPIVFNQAANLVKPWTNNQKQANTDLNAMMSKLNIQKPVLNTDTAPSMPSVKKSLEKEVKNSVSDNSESDTESDSSDSLSFLNEKEAEKKSGPLKQPLNLIQNSLSVAHTPPVKLQAVSKFLQQKPLNGSVVGTAGESNGGSAAANKPNVNQFNSNAGMSVSYAFMKNSSQLNGCLPPSTIDLPTQQASLSQAQLPQPQHPQSTLQFTAPSLSYQPKFLQTANINTSYQAFNPMPSFNQNTFSQVKQPTTIVQQSSSSSSSSSSQASVVLNNQQTSPTGSEATPYVYMVEKSSNVLTPQASKIRAPQHDDRPPSPQESVCSMMSDSSIPSLIRQDISRNTQGFQQIKQQPQKDFKALFNKLNQQSAGSDGGLPQPQQGLNVANQNTNNNLMPAFNFLKSQQFNHIPQHNYFSNSNTPTNNNHPSSLNYSDLDCTYSPKIFQNEGTNSRYDSSDNEEVEEETDNDKTSHLIQNSTTIESCAKSFNQADQDDHDDELLLENFIKEMLPPVASASPQPVRSRMASSISSEAPFIQLSAKTKIKNSGSSSSLNALPTTRPRINFSRHEKTRTTLTKPLQRPGLKPTNKPLKKSEPERAPIKKPLVQAASKQAASKAPTKATATSGQAASRGTSVQSKAPSAPPVVVMTKTAQLRAKMVSSNNQMNTSVATMGARQNTQKPKPVVSGTINRSQRLKENINSQKTGSSVQLNPHLDHLNRAGVRRKSFTCGSTSNRLDKLKKQDGDTSVLSLTNSNVSMSTSGSGKPIAKPKTLWK